MVRQTDAERSEDRPLFSGGRLSPFTWPCLSKQRKFPHEVWRDRRGMADDPLAHAIRITLSNACHISRYLRDLLNNKRDDVHIVIEEMKGRVLASKSNRVRLYE